MDYLEHIADSSSFKVPDGAVQHTRRVSTLLFSEIHHQSHVLALKTVTINVDDLQSAIVALFGEEFREAHARHSEEAHIPPNQRKLAKHIKKNANGCQVSIEFSEEYHKLLLHCLNYYSGNPEA